MCLNETELDSRRNRGKHQCSWIFRKKIIKEAKRSTNFFTAIIFFTFSFISKRKVLLKRESNMTEKPGKGIIADEDIDIQTKSLTILSVF